MDVRGSDREIQAIYVRGSLNTINRRDMKGEKQE